MYGREVLGKVMSKRHPASFRVGKIYCRVEATPVVGPRKRSNYESSIMSLPYEERAARILSCRDHGDFRKSMRRTVVSEAEVAP